MKKIVLFIVACIVLVLGFIAVNQFLYVQKAHSTFANYYRFRGCVKLLQKTNTFATCALQSGTTIKIVNVNGKWYLDKDLPVCYFSFCI